MLVLQEFWGLHFCTVCTEAINPVEYTAQICYILSLLPDQTDDIIIKGQLLHIYHLGIPK